MAIAPERFVHPAQTYLSERLNYDLLPDGAGELIAEAIDEYQQTFSDPDFRSKIARRVESPLFVERREVVGEGFADSQKWLTLKFGLVNPQVSSAFSYMPVMLMGSNFEAVDLYPCRLRYVRIDENGNSAAIRFLINVPHSVKGQSARLMLYMLNGEAITNELIMLFSL